MTIADQPPTHDMREALAELVALDDANLPPAEHFARSERAWVAARAALSAAPEADTILRELVACFRSESSRGDNNFDRLIAAREAAIAWADAQKAAPPAQPNADYCRYGVCKVDEPHVPGCVEWTPAERAQHKSEPAPSPPDAQPAGWQPIETAPKDGTEILGARDDLWGGLPSIDVRVCSWEPLDNPVAKEWGLAGTWHRRHVVSGKGLMGESFQPTHWMPLSPLAARQVAQEQTP
jgi:hypothetical protein